MLVVALHLVLDVELSFDFCVPMFQIFGFRVSVEIVVIDSCF